MKNIILFIALMIMATTVWAGEVTGAGQRVDQILKTRGLSINQLKGQGYKVLLGEVTGAGKTVAIDDIQFIVAKNKLFQARDITHIDYKHPSAAKMITDIEAIELGAAKVRTQEVDAFIVK